MKRISERRRLASKDSQERLRVSLACTCALASSVVLWWLYSQVRWPSGLLGFVIWVPYFVCLQSGRTWRQAVGLCALFTASFTVVTFEWFARAVAEYTGAAPVVSLGLLAASSPLWQFPCLVAGMVIWTTRHLEEQPAGWFARGLLVSGTYVGLELALPKLLADTVGQGLLATPILAQAADLCGVHGLSFLMVLGNVLVASAVLCVHHDGRTGWRRALARLALAGTLIAGLAAYGVVRWQEFAPFGGRAPIVVGVVQGNLAHYDWLRAERGAYGAVRTILDRYFELTRLGHSPDVDFWVWPETVYPTTFGQPKSEAGAELDAEILRLVEELDRPLVFGAYDRDSRGEYVAAFFTWPMGGTARIGAVYRKTALFPFTEWVPEWADSLGLRRWAPWLGTWRRGSGAQIVEVPRHGSGTIRLLPLLCYDALWPEYADVGAEHGADLLVILSNDSWFSDGRGLWLPLVAGAFRSVETRRPQVRITPTGSTALVSPRGEIEILVPPGRSGVAHAKVGRTPESGRTWAIRLRGWPTFALLCLLPLSVGGGLAFGPWFWPARVGGQPSYGARGHQR